MRVYLLRHAIAVKRETAVFANDDRPLADKGRKKMTKEAKGIAAFVGIPDVILTSPLSRAKETATIAATETGTTELVEICPELLPSVPVKNTIAYLAKYNGLSSLMIVGHEPHLSSLASALVGVDHPVLEFKKGGLCCIDVAKFPARRPGRIVWHLTPKQLRKLG